MSTLLAGAPARDFRKASLRTAIGMLSARPHLAIIRIGEDTASAAYIRQKVRFGEEIGAHVSVFEFPADVEESVVLAKVTELNADARIHGVIVQLPLPQTLDRGRIINAIAPEKDVDGLSAISITRRREGLGGFVPATARGILELLRHYRIPLKGKQVAVMGRSALVGAPTAELLEREGADVSIIHSGTTNPESITRNADILVVAIGKPQYVGVQFLKAGQVVIDVGINAKSGPLMEEAGKRSLVGDVDFAVAEPLVAAISPVPGGVGVMTVLALFENLIEAAHGQLSADRPAVL